MFFTIRPGPRGHGGESVHDPDGAGASAHFPAHRPRFLLRTGNWQPTTGNSSPRTLHSGAEAMGTSFLFPSKAIERPMASHYNSSAGTVSRPAERTLLRRKACWPLPATSGAGRERFGRRIGRPLWGSEE